MFELNAIERACDRTLAGLKSIVLIDPNDLQDQPAYNIVPDVAALDFKPGAGAYTFHTSIHSARLEDETDTGQIQGDLFQYKISAFVRGIRGEVELLRAKMKHRRFHIVATYRDGEQRFVPYMRISARGDSGARAGNDKRGYYFTGIAQLDRPAPFVGGTFDIIGGPPVAPDPDTPDGSINIIPITTTDPSYTYSIPSGMLLIAIYVIGSSAQEISVGLTAGGNELGGPIPLTAGSPGNKATFETVFRAPALTPVYISGLVGTNNIEIWLIG